MLTKQEIFRSKGYDVPSFILDADGKRIEIETSENEEQCLAYDKIVSTFVHAGYLRARIKGLNPFDVMVGGMTWCLDSSSLDLEVDLLFREEQNVGQKIALTEKIVIVLPQIKCPFFIEPHQIQGLDFIHILPVIEWLIKWSHDNRRRKAKYLEEYAVNQYYKTFADPFCDNIQRIEKIRSENIDYLMSQHQPRRVCKQFNSNLITDLKVRIENTLAEYGINTNDKDLLKHTMKKKDNAAFSMEKLNFDNVDQLLSSDYRIHHNQKEIRLLQKELDMLKDAKLSIGVELGSYELQLNELTHENSKIIELNSLNEEQKIVVKGIQSIIQTHEKLKDSEKKFKDSCKVEMQILEKEILMLESTVSTLSTDVTDEVSVQVAKLQNKLTMKKSELGKVARIVTNKERIFDEIPCRAELSQYQKRFVELHHQMAMKHKELKQYFILFNMLRDKLNYLEKEDNLLTSMHDNYIEMKCKGIHDKVEFLKQLRNIVNGIDSTEEKILKSNVAMKRKRNTLSDELLYMQTLKNEYVNLVKELSEAYKTNGLLEERLQVFQTKYR